MSRKASNEEREDTEEKARTERLKKAVPVSDRIQSAYHDSKNIYDDVLTQGSFLLLMVARI